MDENIKILRLIFEMKKTFDLVGNDYPIVCIAPTIKGFICGHKNAGIIGQYEIENDKIKLIDHFKIKEEVKIIAIF